MSGNADPVPVDIVNILVDILHQLEHTQPVVAAVISVLFHRTGGIACTVGVHIEYHKSAPRKLDRGDVLRLKGGVVAMAGDNTGRRIFPAGGFGLMDQNPQRFPLRHGNFNIHNLYPAHIRLNQARADAADQHQHESDCQQSEHGFLFHSDSPFSPRDHADSIFRFFSSQDLFSVCLFLICRKCCFPFYAAYAALRST